MPRTGMPLSGMIPLEASELILEIGESWPSLTASTDSGSLKSRIKQPLQLRRLLEVAIPGMVQKVRFRRGPQHLQRGAVDVQVSHRRQMSVQTCRCKRYSSGDKIAGCLNSLGLCSKATHLPSPPEGNKNSSTRLTRKVRRAPRRRGTRVSLNFGSIRQPKTCNLGAVVSHLSRNIGSYFDDH